MVKTDQNALASIFPAHDIARYGMSYDAGVREGEDIGGDAAPTICAKFDLIHLWRSIREACYWLKTGGPQKTDGRDYFGAAYRRCLRFFASRDLTIFPTSCARSRGQIKRASGVSTTTKSRTPMAATNLLGLQKKLPWVSRASPSPTNTLSSEL